MKKLNLGCGRDIREGYVNTDYYNEQGVDLVWDLNKYPYPFKDNEFDEIYARDILEHLDSPEKCIREMWRISKNGAKINIMVPHYNSVTAWEDMTHKRGFSKDSMRPFDVSLGASRSSEYDRKEKFKVKIIMSTFRIYRWLGILWLANHTKKFYKHYLAHLFPIQGLEFHLETCKN